MFTQSQIYRRRDIHQQFGGQAQGGISTPARFPIVLMFTSDEGEQYGYHDGWHNDGLFYYTGEGQSGDMRLEGGNRAIAQHVEDGEDLHLFKYVRKAFVQYIGQFVCIGNHTRHSIGLDGVERKAIVFELVPMETLQDSDDLLRMQDGAKPEVDIAALRARATGAGAVACEPIQRLATIRERSRYVKQYVLARAAGHCEGCEQPAPFQTAQGFPYLEPHHIRRLSDGGPDHPAWVVAVCPNCHRHAHYAADALAYNDQLKQIVNRLERLYSGDNTLGLPSAIPGS